MRGTEAYALATQPSRVLEFPIIIIIIIIIYLIIILSSTINCLIGKIDFDLFTSKFVKMPEMQKHLHILVYLQDIKVSVRVSKGKYSRPTSVCH